MTTQLEALSPPPHAGLRQRLQHFVLVGQIDGQSMLVQEGLDLILVNTSALAHDLFYQLVCFRTDSITFLYFIACCREGAIGARQAQDKAGVMPLQPVQAVEGWGIFPSIVIANPVSIATLVSIALKDQVPKDKVSPAPICAHRSLTLVERCPWGDQYGRPGGPCPIT